MFTKSFDVNIVVVASLVVWAAAREFLDLNREGAQHPVHGTVVAHHTAIRQFDEKISNLKIVNFVDLNRRVLELSALTTSVDESFKLLKSVCSPLDEEYGLVDHEAHKLRENLRTSENLLNHPSTEQIRHQLEGTRVAQSAALEAAEVKFGQLATLKQYCDDAEMSIQGFWLRMGVLQNELLTQTAKDL